MTWRVRVEADRWVLEGDEGAASCSVRRDGDGWGLEWPGAGVVTMRPLRHGGFRVTAGDGRELARSSPPLGLQRDTRLRHIVLEDGRLFRLVRGAATVERFELRGWETPGAYLEARADGGAWCLAATTAGTNVIGMVTLALLVGMEIVDAEASRAGTI